MYYLTFSSNRPIFHAKINSMIGGFLKGLSSYGTAIQLTFRYGLWLYYLVPALISILLGGGIGYGIWSVSDDLAGWMMGLWPFEWGKAWVDNVAQVFGGLAVGALGFVIFRNLVLALAGPFMSLLSEKVERKLSGQPAAPFSVSGFVSDLIRGLRIALRLIVRELFFTVVFLLLGLFPLFSPFAVVFIFVTQAYYAGFGNLDFTLERHFRVRDSIRFVRRNRGLAIGNGTVYLLLLFSVVGFLVALPLATVAGCAALRPLLEKEG